MGRLQSEANHLHRGGGGGIEIAFGLAHLEMQTRVDNINIPARTAQGGGGSFRIGNL